MLRPGLALGPYLLLQRLGRGGFASVWEAETAKGDRVALKILHADHLSVKKANIAERFLSEARVLAGVKHPGVVRVLDVLDLRPHGPVMYAMERLVGQDLEAVAAELDGASLLALAQQAVDTLTFLHAQGIVHRDIKPANLFVCRSLGQPLRFSNLKLIDFGIAKDLSDDERTATGVLLGTMRNMAPESFRRLSGADVRVTPALDQWGLGVALYRLLSGRQPFGGEGLYAIMEQVLNEPVPPLTLAGPFRGDLQALALIPVVARCLEKSPGARYPSMAALGAVLRGIAAEGEATWSVDEPSATFSEFTEPLGGLVSLPVPGPAAVLPDEAMTVRDEPLRSNHPLPQVTRPDRPLTLPPPVVVPMPSATRRLPISNTSKIEVVSPLARLGRWLLLSPLGVVLVVLAMVALFFLIGWQIGNS